MANEQREVRKQNHRKGMRLLAALAIEHGLRFLDDTRDAETKKMIEQDIAVVRAENDFEIRRRFADAKHRKAAHTPESLMLQGSRALLALAKHKGTPRDGSLRMVMYFPIEAAFLHGDKSGRSSQEQEAESKWQATVIDPLQNRLMEDYGGETVPSEIEKLQQSV